MPLRSDYKLCSNDEMSAVLRVGRFNFTPFLGKNDFSFRFFFFGGLSH